MGPSFGNMSFDGSPVQFRLDAPLLVYFDPLALEVVRDLLTALPAATRANTGIVLPRLNGGFSTMSCYQVAEFRPGLYALDPRDIRKFDSAVDDDLDYEEAIQEECKPRDVPARYPCAGTDSAALVLADFAHLARLVEFFTWDEYDRYLRGDECVVEKIIHSLGGPFFAVISGGCMPGMEFDGDGTYTIKPGAVRLCGRFNSP